MDSQSLFFNLISFWHCGKKKLHNYNNNFFIHSNNKQNLHSSINGYFYQLKTIHPGTEKCTKEYGEVNSWQWRSFQPGTSRVGEGKVKYIRQQCWGMIIYWDSLLLIIKVFIKLKFKLLYQTTMLRHDNILGFIATDNKGLKKIKFELSKKVRYTRQL